MPPLVPHSLTPLPFPTSSTSPSTYTLTLSPPPPTSLTSPLSLLTPPPTTVPTTVHVTLSSSRVSYLQTLRSYLPPHSLSTFILLRSRLSGEKLDTLMTFVLKVSELGGREGDLAVLDVVDVAHQAVRGVEEGER